MFNWILRCCLMLYILPVSGQTHQIYISPSGNNGNPGTKESPVASIHHAQQMWRQHRKQHPRASIQVVLQGGTYYLDSTLVLTPADNADMNTFLFIMGYPGEDVVFSGAIPFGPVWEPWQQGIYKTAVPPVIRTIDRLFIDGEPQILARYPNYDSTARFYHGTAEDAISPARIRGWKQPKGAIVHALHRSEWGGYHYRITGVDEKGEGILEGGWQNNRQMGLHPSRRFVENVLEELDAPREWYFDSATHTLYYMPPPGGQLPEIVSCASLKELIVMKGSAQQPIKQVVLNNITFAENSRTFMLTNEPLLRSDWTIYRGGALMMEGAEYCYISNCKFDQVGGNAIFLNNYNRYVNVDSCHIYKAGASGIAFVGSPDAVRSPAFEYNQFVPYAQQDRTPGPKHNNYPHYCDAKDNLIQYTGEVEKQSAGIQISMSANITVSHNTIHHVPRAGINVSEGTWGGHIIEFNDVYHTVLETGDHGAFNSWGRDRFWHPDRRVMDSATMADIGLVTLDARDITVLRNNRFRCDHGWDIDLDDGSSNYRIYNNVCLNGGLKLREGFFRIVENNIMINNSFHPHVWFANSGDIFRHNIVTAGYKPIGITTWGEEVDYNFFPDKASLQAAQANGTDSHSGFGDPEFQDFTAGNYQVKPRSKALAIGFRNFPMNEFGVRIPRLKAMAAPVPLPEELYARQTAGRSSITWKGATVKNIESLGERSATGLPDENGAWFEKVPEGCEAHKAGFRTGDVVIAMEAEKISNIAGFIAKYQEHAWKQSIQMTVFRNQRAMELKVTK